MNERAYQVEWYSDGLTIRRKSDGHLLTVCFQDSFHENAMESKLDVLKYVHDFVGQAIDDGESSATVRGSLPRERDSMAETAELKKLVEAVSEVLQEVLQMEGMDDGEADKEAVVKLRKAQKAFLEAAKMTVRNACRARGFDNETTNKVMSRVFLGGSSLWAAIEEEEHSQQQKRNNEKGFGR